MKQIFLNVQDSKFKLFLEFIQTLDYVEIGKSIEELEDMEDIRLYDQAKKEDNGERILLSDYIKKRKAKNA